MNMFIHSVFKSDVFGLLEQQIAYFGQGISFSANQCDALNAVQCIRGGVG
jgi:hypothetical protein